MRRRLVAIALGAVVAWFAVAAPSTSLSAQSARVGPPHCGEVRDLALINGKIHTFDEHHTVMDSVLIRGNKFAAVGRIGGLGPCTDVINLRGRTVIPGLIDNHVHFIRLANRPGYDTRSLETAFTVEAALDAIRERAKEAPEGEFITAIGGITRHQFAEGRFPTLAELDAAAPRHPVYLSESGFGPGQTNTAGRDILRALGVPVGDDGVVASGDDTDLAYDAPAASLTDAHRKRQLLDEAKYALSVGLTTVMDMSGTVPGVGFLDPVRGYDFFLELVRENALKVRTRIFFPALDEDTNNTQLQGYLDNKWPEFGPDMAKVVGIGEWAVGRQSFNDPLGPVNRKATEMIAERGWIYHQHVISEEEIEGHLDLWEEINETYPVGELRWSLGHLNGLTVEQIQRANALGIGLGLHGWRYMHRGSGGPPFRTALERAEVPLGAGTDGARISTLNPWNMIYYMVTGRNSAGELINDGEQITREQAIRLYASPDQGWFSREEHVLGGIGVGRYADLVVLRENIFDERAVPDEEIRHMTSVLTIVNGEIVYDDGTLRIPR